MSKISMLSALGWAGNNNMNSETNWPNRVKMDKMDKEKSGINCYIALDEFQQVGEYPEDNVEAILRSLLERVHNVHIIFSGSKQHVMDMMFSSPKHPFYRSTWLRGLE